MASIMKQESNETQYLSVRGQELANGVARALAGTGNSHAHCLQEAWVILETVLSTTKTFLLSVDHTRITMTMHENIWQMVHERVMQKKPLQYLVKSVPFCNLTLEIVPPIFIPRPETEEWCLRLIGMLQPYASQNLIILEIGIGSGAISLALARAFPHFRIIGVDVNPEALALAERNKIVNACPNVLWAESDVYSAFDAGHQFDLIISNPPYVTAQEWAVMDEGVTAWEDKRAFVADDNGLAVYKKILDRAVAFLRLPENAQPDLPRLVFEIGAKQAKDVTRLARDKGFEPMCFQDYAGKDRMIVCY